MELDIITHFIRMFQNLSLIKLIVKFVFFLINEFVLSIIEHAIFEGIIYTWLKVYKIIYIRIKVKEDFIFI